MSAATWYHIGVITVLNLIAIGGIHYLRQWIKEVEITRKLAHLNSGLLGLLLPRYFPVNGALWPMLLLWIGFTGFLYFTYQRKLLSSINGIARKTVGAYIMPTTLTGLWFFNRLLFQKTGQIELAYFDIPILVLTFGDSLAAFVGSRYGKTKLHARSQKTWVGFTTIFLLSFLLYLFYSHFISQPFVISVTTSFQNVGIGLAIAVSAAVAEAVSVRGWDNLSIPTIVFIVLVLFI